MIIGNAKLFLDGAFQEGSLTFENGVITAVGPAQVGFALHIEIAITA